MNIRVDLQKNIYNGMEVVFRSPVDCSQVTGLIVYYIDNGYTVSKEFAFADAHGNNVGDIDHLFAENVIVKVILDVTTAMAFVQNADTNAYIESTFVKTVNGVKPDENGNVNAGYSKTVLWQNESPSNKFSNQTIALPLEEYDAVEIVYEYYTYGAPNFLGTTGELPVMEGFSALATLEGAGSYPTTITITTSGVAVKVEDRETNIPYIIYGIKHGSSAGEVSYTNVLDSVGYQVNKYISSGDEEDNVGTDLTGFIMVVGGDVIRLKNVTMPDVDGFANRVYCYNWNKSLVNVLSITSANTANSPVFKNGNLVQFTILDGDIKEYIGDEGWIRIGAANIDSKSVITVNEEIE